MSWSRDKAERRFRQFAIGDRVLALEGIRYLLFFEGDARMGTVMPDECPFPYMVFPSKTGGQHIVGWGLHLWEEKEAWFDLWRAANPSADYRMEKMNHLAPYSDEELAFIYVQAGPSETVVKDYYRDKAVFEGDIPR